MHAHPEQNWGLVTLAKEAGLSRSGLSERFKHAIGITPLAYLTEYRLRLAARYLREGQYSITKISELVGYASDTSFNQAFKRAYDIAPRNYRQSFMR